MSHDSRPVTSDPGPRWLGDAAQLALAGLMAAVLLPVSVLSVFDGRAGATWTVVLLVALGVVHLSVAGARRFPRAAFTVGALALLVVALAPDLDGEIAIGGVGGYSPILLPSSLCFMALLFGVAANAERPWPTAALGVGLAGCVVTIARLWGFSLPGVESWAYLLIVATAVFGATFAAWALGRFRAVRSAWEGELAARGAADERRRIAREMHDVVAHSLAVVVGSAEGGRLAVANDPARAPEILETIADTGREALGEMRGLLGILRDEGPPGSAQPGVDQVSALVERMQDAGLSVTYVSDGTSGSSPTASLTVYRLVQEALTNVARHAAPGATAWVSIAADRAALVVEVSNDGGRAEDAPPGGGLTGMRERVEAVGGELRTGPADDGWRVWARLP